MIWECGRITRFQLVLPLGRLKQQSNSEQAAPWDGTRSREIPRIRLPLLADGTCLACTKKTCDQLPDEHRWHPASTNHAGELWPAASLAFKGSKTNKGSLVWVQGREETTTNISKNGRSSLAERGVSRDGNFGRSREGLCRVKTFSKRNIAWASSDMMCHKACNTPCSPKKSPSLYVKGAHCKGMKGALQHRIGMICTQTSKDWSFKPGAGYAHNEEMFLCSA